VEWPGGWLILPFIQALAVVRIRQSLPPTNNLSAAVAMSGILVQTAAEQLSEPDIERLQDGY